MKSIKRMCVTLMALFTVLATPLKLSSQQHRQYKLVDITLGGAVSYLQIDFTGGRGGIPRLVNSQGIAVGAADSSTANPTHGIGSGFMPDDPVTVHAFQWLGVLTDLGTLQGGSNSFANGISESGLIAGLSENGVIDPQFGIAQVNAVLWIHGDIINLGGYFSEAFAVNNRGQVVGSTIDPATITLQAFLWQQGEMQELGTLGGPGSIAFLINEQGQVSGIVFPNSNASTNCPFGFVTDPFLEEKGKMVDLGSLGGTCGLTLALNNRGQVVGISNLQGDQTGHPFLWDNGVLRDLQTLGGSFGFAQAINDAGEIAGAATTKNDEATRPFLWKNGVMTDLGTLNSEPCSTAQGMNSIGQVVGVSWNCVSGGHAWLWETGGPLVDLNTFVPSGSPITLEIAENINNRGEIAALGRFPGCEAAFDCGHAFLLIPVCVDGTEGCADAPLDPAVVAQSRATSGAPPKTMTAEELAIFKERIARITDRGFRLWPWR